MPKLKHHFFLPEYINVFDLDQIYMTSSMWHDTGMKDTWATFDLLVRNMPKNRNFLVFTGLEEMVLGLKHFKFSDEQIRILLKWKLISKKFAGYLKKIKFNGDVKAMPEGTLFFPGEIVMRLTAPLIEGNLLTAFLITSLSSNTIFASKFIRSVIAAKPLNIIGPAPNRAHAFESALKAERSGFITGSMDCPSVIAREKMNLMHGDNATIAYHAFINSYATEKEAMETAAKYAKVDLSLMVDTYDYKQGIKNAIKVAEKLKKQGKKLKIVVDSGDLYKNAVFVRKELDKAGLKEVRITVASNLNEFKIKKLMDKKIPANTFIVSTEALTSSDDPRMEAVYKISEIIKPDGTVVNKMKLSPGKMSLPGRKQVYRQFKNDKMTSDIIGLEGEKKLGTPLLRPIFKKGKLLYDLPSVLAIRDYVKSQLEYLPKKYLAIETTYQYPVRVSPRLRRLITKTKKEIRGH